MKFRGYGLRDHELHYAKIVEVQMCEEIIDTEDNVDHEWVSVAPESLTYLIGYDSNGAEVYFGDEVILTSMTGERISLPIVINTLGELERLKKNELPHCLYDHKVVLY